MILLQENHNCINRAGIVDESPVHGRADVSPEHCQIIIQLSGTTNKEQKFRLGTLNVVTMRSRAVLSTGSKMERCIS